MHGTGLQQPRTHLCCGGSTTPSVLRRAQGRRHDDVVSNKVRPGLLRYTTDTILLLITSYTVGRRHQCFPLEVFSFRASARCPSVMQTITIACVVFLGASRLFVCVSFQKRIPAAHYTLKRSKNK